jgi:hypothetical protein
MEWGKAENIPSKIRNMTIISTLSTLINIVLKFLARAMGQGKEINEI